MTEFRNAVGRYKDLGKWLKVIEADYRHTCDVIRSMAEDEKAQHGKPPVIVIDYLQAMPSGDAVGRDKRHEVDAIVSDLRRIARDVGCPIVLISSMSRGEYQRCQLSAFKESGGIEYGADVACILGCTSETNDGKERDMVLSVIKNRMGRRGKVQFTYSTETDTFSCLPSRAQPLTYLASLGGDQPE